MPTIEKHTLRTAHDAITRRVDFNCNGTLRGIADAHKGMGRLPAHWHSRFMDAIAYGDLYTVYSYATPIAWFANGVWTMPEVKYSVTTSKHQTVTRRGMQ